MITPQWWLRTFDKSLSWMIAPTGKGCEQGCRCWKGMATAFNWMTVWGDLCLTSQNPVLRGPWCIYQDCRSKTYPDQNIVLSDYCLTGNHAHPSDGHNSSHLSKVPNSFLSPPLPVTHPHALTWMAVACAVLSSLTLLTSAAATTFTPAAPDLPTSEIWGVLLLKDVWVHSVLLPLASSLGGFHDLVSA